MPNIRMTYRATQRKAEVQSIPVNSSRSAEPDGLMASLIGNGWPRVLSNLKTLLETGETLPDSSVARTPANLRVATS